LAACEAQGVPAGPINDLAEVFADPQVIARALQIAPGGVPGIRSPMSFSGADLSLERPAPTLGEHQNEILGKL
jgi:crotonobetainyl-CoA:carnitine CoA-transferase CaiB-like acyl-CoA transferase